MDRLTRMLFNQQINVRPISRGASDGLKTGTPVLEFCQRVINVDMDNITRESPSPLIEPPPLDPTLFLPEKYELEFLRNSISEKEDEMKQRILEVQTERADYRLGCFSVKALISSNPTLNPGLSE